MGGGLRWLLVVAFRGNVCNNSTEMRVIEMSVSVSLPAVLARLAGGQRSLVGKGSTVGDVISDITSAYPALTPRLRGEGGEPYAFVTIYLNDEDIRFAGGFDAPVKSGDEVVVVPAIAGG